MYVHLNAKLPHLRFVNDLFSPLALATETYPTVVCQTPTHPLPWPARQASQNDNLYNSIIAW